MSTDLVNVSVRTTTLEALGDFPGGEPGLGTTDEVLLDAYHLLRLQDKGEWKHAFDEEETENYHELRCVEQCRLLKAERDGYSDALCRACAPHAPGPSHHLSSTAECRTPFREPLQFIVIRHERHQWYFSLYL